MGEGEGEDQCRHQSDTWTMDPCKVEQLLSIKLVTSKFLETKLIRNQIFLKMEKLGSKSVIKVLQKCQEPKIDPYNLVAMTASLKIMLPR